LWREDTRLVDIIDCDSEEISCCFCKPITDSKLQDKITVLFVVKYVTGEPQLI